MADLAEVLQAVRTRLGLSQTELAGLIGVVPSTISERERGLKSTPNEDLKRLADLARVGIVATGDGWEIVDREAMLLLKASESATDLQRSLDNLKAYGDARGDWEAIEGAAKAGPTTAVRRPSAHRRTAVPYYGQVPCGRPLLMEDPPEADLDISAITGGAWDTHDGFVIQADGDSMEPHIRDGDWLVCRRQKTWKNWDLVVVFIDGSSTVKQVQPHPDTDRAGEQCLAPLNQRYGPYLDVEGAVVEMYGRVLGKLLYADLR